MKIITTATIHWRLDTLCANEQAMQTKQFGYRRYFFFVRRALPIGAPNHLAHYKVGKGRWTLFPRFAKEIAN
jgi:hypothetical protein